jgi:hypothetical protein
MEEKEGNARDSTVEESQDVSGEQLAIGANDHLIHHHGIPGLLLRHLECSNSTGNVVDVMELRLNST